MSHDPRSPSDAADHAGPANTDRWSDVMWRLYDAMHDPRRAGGCENCGDTDEFSPDCEAFEVTGRLLCSLCAEDALAGEDDE